MSMNVLIAMQDESACKSNGNMKRVKITTSNAELEEFLARTDIEVINVDVRSCEPSLFAQEYFTAAIYYDDEPKSKYNPDYWTRLEHQAAIAAMQGLLQSPHLNIMQEEPLVGMASSIAHALVEKYKKEERKWIRKKNGTLLEDGLLYL